MRITVVSVGPMKRSPYRAPFESYAARIGRYVPFESVEVKDETASTKLPLQDVLRREAASIAARIGKMQRPFVVAMDEGGGLLSSAAFAGLVSGVMAGKRGGVKGIVFVVGGAYGLDGSIKAAADEVVSLSRMTLTHDLARLLLAEQIYRAFTIIRGEPYSH